MNRFLNGANIVYLCGLAWLVSEYYDYFLLIAFCPSRVGNSWRSAAAYMIVFAYEHLAVVAFAAHTHTQRTAHIHSHITYYVSLSIYLFISYAYMPNSHWCRTNWAYLIIDHLQITVLWPRLMLTCACAHFSYFDMWVCMFSGSNHWNEIHTKHKIYLKQCIELILCLPCNGVPHGIG